MKTESIILEDIQLSVDYWYGAARAETKLEPEEFEQIDIINVYNEKSDNITDLIFSLDAEDKLAELIIEQRKINAE